jgi:putative FmdB family regulatory protein
VTFERVQKFNDKPLTRCPECRGKVSRVIGASAVVFKGSGWYINDSKSSSSPTVTGGKKKNAETSEASAPSTEAKSEAKAESKPAAASSD